MPVYTFVDVLTKISKNSMPLLRKGNTQMISDDIWKESPLKFSESFQNT